MEDEEAATMNENATMQQQPTADSSIATADPTATTTASEEMDAVNGSVVRRITLSPDLDAESPSNKRSIASESAKENNENESQSANNTTMAAEADNAMAESSDKEEDDPPVERETKRARTIPVPLGPIPMPTQAERAKALAEYSNPADRALQLLVWDIGCRYTLLPHQPEAVRAVAGLPESFPHYSAHDGGTDKMSSTAKFKAFPIQSKTKGILLADEMGLGKTVESIVGMILRNKWCDAHGKRRLPSLIVAPNDQVLTQWRETLIKAGVSAARIRYYKPKSSTKLEGNFFILMTRYNIQTTARNLFSKVDMRDKREIPSSPLFPIAPKPLLHKLKNQYQADKGKAKNLFKRTGESEATCVARILETFIEDQQFERRSLAPSFRTVILDEGHFMRNITSFWGCGAALLGINSERIVPCTGTPFCNGNQDLASLMAFIDPTHGASRKNWWDQKTSNRAGKAVAEALGDWRQDFMVLRKKSIVLAGKIPPKRIESMTISPQKIELFIYDHEEEKFINVLEKFCDTYDDSPYARQRLLELFSYAMAFLANMRKVLIHPMLISGRELSIRFSPSRHKLLARQEKPKECVCCKAFKKKKKEEADAGAQDSKPPARNRRRGRRRNASEWEMNLDDDQLNDDEAEFSDDEEEDSEKGPIIPLPCDLCDWSDGPCRHFAHEKCVDVLREEGATCPNCQRFNSIVHLNQTMISLDDSSSGQNLQTSQIAVDHRTYCRNISVSPSLPGGFKASAKIERIMAWLHGIPQDEKVIVYSFFKGGLDLIEGILYHDFGSQCARFDGDFDPKVRQADLDRFKTDPSCRVLLMTVQSGGTGLNIVEANNVCFMDRWFNPTVHAQAEDRCHRIGQQKQVNIFFADVATTVDEVMAFINIAKATNASIILADGTQMGRNDDGALSFKDLAGLFGNLIRHIRLLRQASASENYNAPLQPIGQAALEAAAENATKTKRSATVKSEKKQPPSEEAASTAATVAAAASAPGSSESPARTSLLPEREEPQPQPGQFETFRTTTVLNLDDSDDDDSLFDDMTPTFKTSGAPSGKVASTTATVAAAAAPDSSESPDPTGLLPAKREEPQQRPAQDDDADDDDSLFDDMTPTFKTSG